MKNSPTTMWKRNIEHVQYADMPLVFGKTKCSISILFHRSALAVFAGFGCGLGSFLVTGFTLPTTPPNFCRTYLILSLLTIPCSDSILRKIQRTSFAINIEGTKNEGTKNKPKRGMKENNSATQQQQVGAGSISCLQVAWYKEGLELSRLECFSYPEPV